MVDKEVLNDSQKASLEVLEQNLLPDGTLLLRANNNWFVHIDPTDPQKTEIFTTVEPGDPESAKKIHRAFLHDGPPYPTLLLEENDLKENGTVGAIQPLVCVLEGKSYVAIQYNTRHNGVVCEAFRKAWSRPAEQPQILSEGGVIVNYTDKDLGRGLSNDARIVGVGNRIAQIEYDLTVVDGVKQLPEIDKGSWMPVEEYLMTTLEHMGKGVVAIAGIADKFPVDKEELEKQINKLPLLVENNFGYNK